MPKKDLKKPKSETVTVRGTLTLKQYELVRELVGVLGSNEQDVVGKILTLWLYNEGFLKNEGSNKKEKSDE